MGIILHNFTFHQPCKAIGSTYITWTVDTFSQRYIDFQTHPLQGNTFNMETNWASWIMLNMSFLYKITRWFYEQSQTCWFIFTYFSPPTLPYKTIRWTDEENSLAGQVGSRRFQLRKFAFWVNVVIYHPSTLRGLPHQNTTSNIVEHMNQRSILSYF